MKLNDYILISRNGSLYKAPFYALSSVLCFKDNGKIAEETLNSISSTIENIYLTYNDTHYTKTEMKSTFCESEKIDSMLSNSTYVLTSDANSKLSKLKTKQNIDDWKKAEVVNCAEVFRNEFKALNKIMEAGKSLEDHYAYEYYLLPENKDIVDGTKQYDD